MQVVGPCRISPDYSAAGRAAQCRRSRHPVPLVMPYMLMMTPMAALFGILVWGDSPGPKLWVGGTIILASILFITLRSRARAQSTIRALEG